MIQPDIEAEMEELEAFIYEYDDEPAGHPTCVMCDGELDWSDYSVLCDDCEADADDHAIRRDAKRARVSGMQVSGRSIKSVLLPTIAKRAREARGKEGRRAP